MARRRPHIAAGLDFGIAPLPKGPAGQATSINPTGAVVYKGTKSPDAAWEFVKYLASPAAQTKLMELKASLPANKEVLAGPFATSFDGAQGPRRRDRVRPPQAVVQGLRRVDDHAPGRRSTPTSSTAPKKTAKQALADVAAAARRDPRRPVTRRPATSTDRRRDRACAAPPDGGAAGRWPARAAGRWLFLAPTLIGLAVLSAGPILATLAISLTKWDLLTAPKLTGLDNYVALLSDDRSSRRSGTPFFYTIVSVPLGLAIALGLALALNHKIRGIAFIRTAYFLPVVTSTIAIALVWHWIYSPDAGLLNQVLGHIGIPSQRGSTTRPWRCRRSSRCRSGRASAVNVIIFLAGLQAIPSELLDAASVDGAGTLGPLPARDPAAAHPGDLLHRRAQPDRRLPGLRPDLRAGQASAPTEATITVVYFIYENGFKFFKMGYASAASWVLFLIVALFTAIYFWSQDRWVHYQ